MNKKSLLEFIQRIIENSSVQKARFSLEELKKILIQQQASEELLLIIEKAIYSVPEMKLMYDKTNEGDLESEKELELDDSHVIEQLLEIAAQRAQVRIAREDAARRYGRC